MPNRAFVRYKKCGDIVPGSLILTNGTYPEPLAGWIEVPMKMECGYIRVSETALPGDPDEICFQGFTLFSNGNSVLSVSLYDTTVAAVLFKLNKSYGFLGKWEASGLTISLLLKPDVAANLSNEGNWTINFFCGG
jgi:hypothetical protein